MKKQGKKYVEALNKVEKNKAYTLSEATELVKDTAITKFDSSVELAIKLNIDAKNANEQLRGSMVLPKGTGKTKKVVVIAKGDAALSAKEAGADYVGDTDLIAKISDENWFDFDIIVATPDMMASLGKLGKVLGPKGLMPNPKTGTVTTNPAKVVNDIKAGMIEFKNDSFGNVHMMVGKVSFKAKDLAENIDYAIKTIAKAKPSSVKGNYINNIAISSTMGPGIKLDKNSFDI